MVFGAIEAGGTKFVCAIGDDKGTIQERIQIPTTTPKETMAEVMAFFEKYEVNAIGIGSFGPVDVNPASDTYGNITTTPKAAWAHYPLLQTLKDRFSVPIGFTTDVNAAALGEMTYGAAKGMDNCLYMTVGTGIGAGAVLNGELLHGLTHPEMGHTYVRRHPDDSYEGACPYHHDCLEGLAAGPAIEQRWGKKGDQLSDIDAVWEMEGYYLAQALMQYILILSPKKIILGGGVMKQKQLFPAVFRHLKVLLNGYVVLPELDENMEGYIVAPGLEDNAGIVGALELAKRAFEGELR